MKKFAIPTIIYVLAFAVICSFAFYGCGSTGATASNTTASTMSLDEALQKSSEARKKVQDAKNTYETAKKVNEATGATDTASNSAKETVQAVKDAANDKIGTIKNQVKTETDAWKETLK